MTDLEFSVRKSPKKSRFEGEKFTKKDFWVGIVGFFLAMAVPYEGMAPFGMAFLAQERKLSVRTFVYLLAVSLGSVAACERAETTKYIGAGLVYLSVLFVLENDVEPDSVVSGILAGVSVFLTGLVVVYWNGFVFLNLVILLGEAVVVMVATLILDKGKKIVKVEKFAPEKLAFDEKISLGAVVALMVLSLKPIYIGEEFSVMNMAASIVILVVATGCGAAYSTGAGVVLGLVCGIDSNYFMPILGAYSFCGFLAGVFSKFGKSGVVSGIVLANAMMAIYTDGAMRAVLSLYEVMSAAVLFVLLPSVYTEIVKKIICIDANEREAIERMKESLRLKLKSVSFSFEAMSRTLGRLADKRNGGNEGDIAAVFDLAADKVCKTCRKSAVCWHKDFDFTYGALMKLMKVMDEKGEIEPYDADERFKAKCLNLPKLVGELNHQLELHRIRKVWRSKLDESRELVGEQLAGMSEIIENLSEEIAKTTVDEEFSALQLRSRFEKRGIYVRDINVNRESGDRYRIIITVKSGSWRDRTKAEIKKIMRNVFKGEIKVKEYSCDGGKYVKLDFCEAERFKVETDFACRAASGKNGDNYRFSHISGGKYVIALSDGMGTGTRASRESEAMLELLDSFLRTGFDSRMAVKFINSIMLLKSEEEVFATIDICIIDLYTGMAEFIKTGAEPSFIIHKGYLDTVKAASLPVGVFADMEAEIASRSFEDGALIVMMTDGIETRDGGNILWVGEYVEELCLNDKDKNVAEKILQAAIERNNGEVNDDMTVLSVKLREVS